MERRLKLSFDVAISDLSALRSWITTLASQIEIPSVIALEGEMGSGKTQFVHYLAEIWNCSGDIQSPSFAIHHTYEGPKCIQHLDLFRLESEDDLESTGFWDLFERRDHVVVIEWAERISRGGFPRDWPLWVIRIAVKNTSRLFHIEKWI